MTIARETAAPIPIKDLPLIQESHAPSAYPGTHEPGPADFAPGIESAFPDQFHEYDCAIEATGDRLPDFFKGTYYFNGPARFASKDLSYKHWLDGDGMVSVIRFEKDKARLKSRYVRTRKFVEEQKAGRPLFRTFGTTFAGDRLNRRNNGLESPVNVSVFPVNNQLLAFGEQSLPWELDADTLETRGEFDFNGQLNDASPFSAHPKFDPESGEIFNFGVSFSSQASRLYFYRFGPEGLRSRRVLPLEYPCSVHDFSLSKNYAVFYLSPYLLDIDALLQEGHAVMDSLRWEPECGSRLLILARNTGEPVASVSIGHRYCLHLINSFEQDGRLTIDVIEFSEPLYRHYQPVPSLFQNVPAGCPVRFVFDLRSRELTKRISLKYWKAPDFPSIDPNRIMRFYTDFWMLGMSAAGNLGRKFFDQLVHASWSQCSVCDVYQCPPWHYLGAEPVFCGAPGSREAVVICQEFDAHSVKTSFLVFDAWRIAKGPIARLALDHALCLGFHAGFKAERSTT
jgi:all-trans-8'-apo-beta-carotenal 15,15'-oxygenase